MIHPVIELTNSYLWLLLDKFGDDWRVVVTNKQGLLIVNSNELASETVLANFDLKLANSVSSYYLDQRWYQVESQKVDRQTLILRIFDITQLKLNSLVDPLTGLYNQNYLPQVSGYEACVLVGELEDDLLIELIERLKPLDLLLIRDHQRLAIFTNNLELSINLLTDYQIGIANKTNNLYPKALIALNHAKLTQQLLVTYNSELGKQHQKRLHVKSAIKDLSNKIYLVYQPICKFTGERIGLEALMRLEVANFGSLVPCEFVGELNQNDYYELTETVFNQVASQPLTTNIHVNLSQSELSNPNLVGLICGALDFYEVEPSRIVLEVNQFVNPILLADLKSVGFKLCLDGYGSKASNLIDILQHKDFVKLHRSLIPNDQYDVDKIKLCKSLRNLTNDLGIKTIVEGIETAQQIELLADLGFNYGQGYYFGKPSRLT